MKVKVFLFSCFLLTAIQGCTTNNDAQNPNDTVTNNTTHPSLKNVICPKDLKICPDGNQVYRVPPNCKFTPCKP